MNAIIRRVFPPFIGGPGSVGLLALRLVAGLAMALHGYGKIQQPTSWMGPGAPVPGLLQACAAVSEFGGGICWMLGLLTPVASSLILATMAVAAGMVHIASGHAFVASQPGQPSYELAAVYLAVALAFLLVGPGRLSLDAALFGRARTTTTEPPPA